MSHNIETRLWINGQFVDSKGGKTFDLYNPATETLVCKLPSANQEDIDYAVSCAKKAQKGWAALSAAARSAVMKKMADLLRKEGEKLAWLEAQSMGRPISGYGNDVQSGARHFEYFAGLGESLGGTTSLNTPGHLNFSIRQPFGVVAGIIPWNVPIIMACLKIAPAVAAGNAIILKSSEKAPLTSIHLASLTKEAGFPDGLINVVSGAGDTGKILAEHMEIRKIAFTGSTRTGRLIQKAAADSNLKNVTLELGGKSPTIVFEDADLEKAVASSVFSLQINAGQICMASTRLYVQETVAEKFLEKYKKSFSNVKHGDPLDSSTTMGPMADDIQGRTVASYLDIGKKEAKVVLGGERVEGLKGHFFQPTIFTEAPETSRINKEEIFGPVLVFHTFKTEEEVIERANDTEYGLYAAVFTKDIDRAMRVAKALEAGSVAINTNSPMHAQDMPFGGWKSSGVGREKSAQALEVWTEVKAIILKHD
ncbi:aldehyde dehydrogenase [Atractiella rhizophila]|nr:aldehyde dehydrogenase [Atractiella rhizophila]